MFIIAHALAGVLLGLLFLHLTGDRRAPVLGIAASLLPDIMDKPLALVFAEFASGRAFFHTLLFVLLVFIATLIFARKNIFVLSLILPCGILLHEVLDSMWELPENWLYPLLGPFVGDGIPPDYFLHNLIVELTTPSEWVFIGAGVVLLAGPARLFTIPEGFFPYERMFRYGMATVLSVMGIVMITGGLFGCGTFFAPTYSPGTGIMAGILAFIPVIVFIKGQVPVTGTTPTRSTQEM